MLDAGTLSHSPEQLGVARVCNAPFRPADEGAVDVVVGNRGSDRIDEGGGRGLAPGLPPLGQEMVPRDGIEPPTP